MKSCHDKPHAGAFEELEEDVPAVVEEFFPKEPTDDGTNSQPGADATLGYSQGGTGQKESSRLRGKLEALVAHAEPVG